MGKTLVAYYSYSGNTKLVAEKIQQITGGDLFEIQTKQQYPKDYNEVVNQAKNEKEQNYLPELLDSGNVSDYDTIYIGTPVWWYTFATPIKTFLTKNDFAGKVIKPFCTHGGGGASFTYTDIHKLCPQSNIKEGFTSYEHSAKDIDIENWVKSV